MTPPTHPPTHHPIAGPANPTFPTPHNKNVVFQLGFQCFWLIRVPSQKLNNVNHLTTKMQFSIFVFNGFGCSSAPQTHWRLFITKNLFPYLFSMLLAASFPHAKALKLSTLHNTNTHPVSIRKNAEWHSRKKALVESAVIPGL